ncbi:MAG: FecR family protein [Bacteroidales bacterium]
MLNEKYIIELIIESRENRLDPIKKSILEEWSKENPSLREKLDNALNEVDELASIKFINNRKPNRDTIIFRSKKRRVLKVIKIGLSYAAAIVLIITIAIFIQSREKINLNSITSKQRAISGKDVVIEFSDGSSILANRNANNIDQNYIITKDSLRVSATRGQSIYPISVYTPSNKIFKVILPDGSAVWLNSNSSINFATEEKKYNRDVTIDGECFFDVSKEMNRPFTVKTRFSRITVLGTRFNVYDKAGEDASVTLESGSLMVECSNLINKISSGEQLNYSNDNKTIVIKEVDTQIYTLWKDGYFVFDNVSFKDILRELSMWYGIEYSIDDYNLQNKIIYAIVKKYQTIDTVMQKLERTVKFTYKIDDERVRVLSNEE